MTVLMAMLIWAGAALLMVVAGLLLLVGHALRTFGRSSRGWQQSFGEFALWPALTLQIRHPVGSTLISWAVWTALGCLVIAGVSILL